MADAFVDPFPNEGALCHSVAAQCRACMEGVQQWSHSLCLLMSRKRPPTSFPVCNKNCKDGPASPPLGVARPYLSGAHLGPSLSVSRLKNLILVGQNSLEKTTKRKNEDVSVWKQDKNALVLCAPVISEQLVLASLLWPLQSCPSLAVGICSCQLFLRLFCVFAHQCVRWLQISVWASRCKCSVKSSSVHLSNKHHLEQEVHSEGSSQCEVSTLCWDHAGKADYTEALNNLSGIYSFYLHGSSFKKKQLIFHLFLKLKLTSWLRGLFFGVFFCFP